MVENRGNATAYAGATSHRPLAHADDTGYRTAHAQQPKKPDTTFDWGWNKATCTSCQTSTPKPQLVEGRCSRCRGEKGANTIPAPVAPAELEHSKDGSQAYETYDDAELDARFTAPEHAPEPDPEPDLVLPPRPAPDGTRLAPALAELEATDPAVAKSAAALDDTIARVTQPDDHVRPENLDVDAAVAAEAARRAEDMLQRVDHPVARLTAEQLSDLCVTHTADVLRRALVITDPMVGMLRSALLSTSAALDLYLEVHHPQTPAASPSPHATAPRAGATEPAFPGARQEQPAVGPGKGKPDRQPATFQTHRRLAVGVRLRTLGVTSRQVKQWAVDRGHLAAVVRGSVAHTVIDAYEAAHPTPTRGDTTA
jgi:hypothetical protein